MTQQTSGGSDEPSGSPSYAASVGRRPTSSPSGDAVGSPSGKLVRPSCGNGAGRSPGRKGGDTAQKSYAQMLSGGPQQVAAEEVLEDPSAMMDEIMAEDGNPHLDQRMLLLLQT